MVRIDWKEKRTLLCLQILRTNHVQRIFSTWYERHSAYFDMFFRKVPDGGGFAIMAGVEQLIEYLKNLRFTAEDLDYLHSKRYSVRILEYLENFQFSCDVWAIPEGTPIFPNEPIVTVVGPVIQAQFVETMVLLSINHQSLIATKANRIVRAAQEDRLWSSGRGGTEL